MNSFEAAKSECLGTSSALLVTGMSIASAGAFEVDLSFATLSRSAILLTPPSTSSKCIPSVIGVMFVRTRLGPVLKAFVAVVNKLADCFGGDGSGR